LISFLPLLLLDGLADCRQRLHAVPCIGSRRIDLVLEPRTLGQTVLVQKSALSFDQLLVELLNATLPVRNAAMLLPPERVILDTRPDVLYDQQDVIGYASWGSNDAHRDRRWSGFHFLPGAIVTEYVSSNARTLKRPPENWTFTGSAEREHFFGGSAQSLSADYIHEGATGVSGNVFEPYLNACVRPEYLFPAYLHGRNLAESYYLALPYLSWQGVIFGDPLCTLK